MKSSTRTYPRQVWVLMPSMKPVQLEVVKPYSDYCSNDYGDTTATGRLYRLDQMHATLADAIAEGQAKIEASKANIAKLQASLEKRTVALNKAIQAADKGPK